MRLVNYLAMLSVAALTCGAAQAKCDYGFSGRFVVKHNGVERPLPNVKVRVRRENGTGLGRKIVQANANGEFEGTWRFDRDQNGRLPGSEKIRFAIQIKLDEDRVKVVKGGWTDAPWDTIKTVRGKDCQTFIYTEPFVIEADSISPNDVHHRAYIYLVHQKLLDGLEANNVGLKNRIEVIYPDRHVYGKDASWTVKKSHIALHDWNQPITLIHEAMHQWDINWLKGEMSMTCLTDGHHKPPEKRGSKRCSGFMEGFAGASAIALHNDLFSPDKFFWIEEDVKTTYVGLQSHKALRESTGRSGSIQNTDEAERNDNGWQNFLQFFMASNPWKPFLNEDNPDVYNLVTCTPRRVPVYELLHILKEEQANHGGDKATFIWFTNIMKRRVPGFTSSDATFYHLLGNPAADPVDIQKVMCANERDVVVQFLAPLRKPNMDDVKSKKPFFDKTVKPVQPPKGLGH